MRRAFRVRATLAVSSPPRLLCAWPLQICQTRRYADDASEEKQAHPFHGYYADLLDAPLHSVQPATRTAPTPPPIEQPPKTEKEERLAKARVVFGSRLAGPAERRKELDAQSKDIAGVYRDELEEWAAKSAEARTKLTEQRTRGKATGLMASEPGTPAHVAISMDDDGGGSETSWDVSGGPARFGEDATADLFQDIPVGIREFMKTEKRLKEKRSKDSTVTG